MKKEEDEEIEKERFLHKKFDFLEDFNQVFCSVASNNSWASSLPVDLRFAVTMGSQCSDS